MFQTDTYPFPQPTIISVGDSQVTQDDTVEGGLASNEADSIMTVIEMSVGRKRFSGVK